MADRESRRTVVLGVGNLLMSDDGLGVHAVRLLAENPPPGVEVYDAGTSALTALDLAENTENLLMIDAVQAGHPPGTIMSCNGFTTKTEPDMPSLHAMGLTTALQLVPEERRPRRFTVIGAEPESLEYGMELSETVHSRLPDILCEVTRILNQWTAA